MNFKITAQLQAFIQAHFHSNLAELALKKELLAGYENAFVLQQIYGKQKAKQKLPSFFSNPTICYPPKTPLAQSSSEKAAKWKANLVKGKTLLDLTGGFGVDAYHFSKRMEQIIYIEQDPSLFSIAQHNFQVLNVANIQAINGNSIDFLKQLQQPLDWIYLDPARRDDKGRRKIGLADCLPNVLEIKNLLLKKSKQILLKAAPMLDIQQAVRQLGPVEKVMILAIQNEVKELLFLIKRNPKPIVFQCVDIQKDDSVTTYQSLANQPISNLTYTLPETYIYEPHAAILKAGLFNEIAIDFNFGKLHPNSHLYTSDFLLENFPGRIFTCQAVVSFNKKQLLPYLSDKKANIATRNFPYSVAEIKKKMGLKDGGNIYLFGTTLMSNQLKILVCKKIEH